MKKFLFSTAIMSLMFSFSGLAQNLAVNSSKANNSKKSSALKTMTWTTKSTAAKEIAQQGSKHLMNVERELAYNSFLSAVKLDPDFTVALTFLANLSRGESRKVWAAKAVKSAANKTEGEKLFASLTNQNTPEQNREIWSKLHDMFPDGEMIGHYYVVTRATPEERFAAAEKYIQQFPDNAAMHNTIAYYYLQDKKDNVNAKKHFDKYMAMYPDGANPYDSMGEYYLLSGDKENAKKYYQLAVEKYPFNASSVIALDKMAEEKAMEEKKMGEVKPADKVQ